MALDGYDWLASGSGRIPRERRDTHCVGGWVGQGAGRDVLEKGKAIACTRTKSYGRKALGVRRFNWSWL
jgi:hypothetical protein